MHRLFNANYVVLRFFFGAFIWRKTLISLARFNTINENKEGAGRTDVGSWVLFADWMKFLINCCCLAAWCRSCWSLCCDTAAICWRRPDNILLIDPRPYAFCDMQRNPTHSTVNVYNQLPNNTGWPKNVSTLPNYLWIVGVLNNSIAWPKRFINVTKNLTCLASFRTIYR